MFTGIIDHCGEIVELQTLPRAMRIWFKSQWCDFQLGESIAVDGTCLTVVDFKDNVFTCEISPETKSLTIADYYKKGDKVNLERPLCLNDRLGGHLVSGHIDQTVFVSSLEQHQEFMEVAFSQVLKKNKPYLVQKGSVAVNGVSLTVNEVFDEGFIVMLIPHTLQRTNLSRLATNQPVNIEFDTVAKLISKQLKPYLSSVTKKEII